MATVEPIITPRDRTILEAATAILAELDDATLSATISEQLSGVTALHMGQLRGLCDTAKSAIRSAVMYHDVITSAAGTTVEAAVEVAS